MTARAGQSEQEDLAALATEAGGTGEPIIVCEGVEKWFGRFQALRGIDLSVGRQEVVVVIGPSGSGKSTLIRCINRLEEHDRGRIVVDGTELNNDVRRIAEVRREVGMVFQSFNLFPHLTVLDNITLGPRKVRRWPKARAEQVAREMLERVKIPEQAGQVPGPAVGRSAAAGGHRPGAGDAAQDHAVRRAHVGPRPGDDRRGARRDAGAGPLGDDDDRGDPRDGLRPRGGRPGHVHGRRRDRRGGYPRPLLPRSHTRSAPSCS